VNKGVVAAPDGGTAGVMGLLCHDDFVVVSWRADGKVHEDAGADAWLSCDRQRRASKRFHHIPTPSRR
jgi:hypothetical protein